MAVGPNCPGEADRFSAAHFYAPIGSDTRYVLVESWGEMVVYEKHLADFTEQVKALEEQRALLVERMETVGVFTALDVPDRVGPDLVAPLRRIERLRMTARDLMTTAPQNIRGIMLLVLALCLGAATIDLKALFVARQTVVPSGPTRWFKGNTHTHTLNSDGDSTPDDVVRWYREHGYQFLVLTDHNFHTRVDGLNALHAADERFLVIRGEEITSTAGGKPVHVNGLDIAGASVHRRAPRSSIAEVLQRSIDAIRGASGVPHINHPNFQWAMTTEDLRQVRNYELLEIFNGHPEVNNAGGGGVPGLEEIWDPLLSNGTLVYGIAVDDAHVFKQPGNPAVAGPGRGWVMVRAGQLEPRASLESLERGDFYASTGVVLDNIETTRRRVCRLL